MRHVAASLTALALTGCYVTHGELRDVGPIDAWSFDVGPVDAAPVDVGAPVDVFHVPIDVLYTPVDGYVVRRDAGDCLCVSDSDCPPYVGGCVASFCAGCACMLRLEPELCAPGSICQPTGECVPVPGHDAGVDASGPVPIDAAVVRRDAYATPIDAFVAPIDAFFVPRDAFVTPIDAATPPGRDAGRPPSSDALRFTATQVMTVPDRPALSLGPELTFEMWARLRSPGVIAVKGEPTVASHLYLELRPSPDGTFHTFWLGWSQGGARTIVSVERPTPADTWTHFALVQRATPSGRVMIELFIDGESATGPIDAGDVMSYLASFNTGAFVIGRTEMDVDEIRLWRVARGQAAIRASMRSELTPGTSGLVAYWPLDGVGQVVLDRSLSGNDGFRGLSPSEDRADPTWILDGAF